MQKIKCIPQIFYKFNLCEEIIKSTLTEVKKSHWRKNEGNYHSHENLKNNTKFDEVNCFFDKCLEEVKKDLNLDCEYLKVVSSWANKTEKGGHHHWHYHQNSWASGVLYLTESDSSTVFWTKNSWSDIAGDSRISVCGEKSPQLNDEYKTSVGDLIIFPSNVFHMVNTHNLNEPRYTISFNSFPCGKIGTFDKLSFMNIVIK